ncbi:MAG: DUF1127 domain-containing protein [Pseudomonadota bacterium]
MIALSQAISRWNRRRLIHRDLSRLDERTLEDIGLNRADVDIRYR